MMGNIKTALVCIVIISIFGCAYLSAFSLPSVAQAANGSRIYGTVLDMNGHGVDQATVKLLKSDGHGAEYTRQPDILRRRQG